MSKIGKKPLNNSLSGSWKSIANDEDISDAVGENAARSWTHRCDRTEGMRQQYLGQVSSPCGPFVSGRGCVAAFLESLERLVDGHSPSSAVCGEGFPSKTGIGIDRVDKH